MTSPAFDALLDSFDPEVDGIFPVGCNLPSIGHSTRHPGLWAQHIAATETGLSSALGGDPERKSDDRFKHLVCFPSWSKGEIAFFEVLPGETVVVDAATDTGLTISTPQGRLLASYEAKIVVLYHSSLDRAAVEAYYREG